MLDQKHPTHKPVAKSDANKKTSPPRRPISKIILIGCLLGGVPVTAIVLKYEGLIQIKMGIEGGQVLIDGRKSPLPSPITNNPSSNDLNNP